VRNVADMEVGAIQGAYVQDLAVCVVARVFEFESLAFSFLQVEFDALELSLDLSGGWKWIPHWIQDCDISQHLILNILIFIQIVARSIENNLRLRGIGSCVRIDILVIHFNSLHVLLVCDAVIEVNEANSGRVHSAVNGCHVDTV